MVVIAIIALLAMLMVPTVNNVLRVSNRTICANNLKRIGEAFAMSNDDNNSSVQGKVINTAAWTQQLGKYIDDAGVFVCPEGESVSQACPPPPLTDLVCVNIPARNLDHEFIDGPFSVRLSEEQFNAIPWQENRLAVLPGGYVPGSDPTVNYWVFEDAPGERWVIDFEVVVRVSDNGDGTLNLKCFRVTTGRDAVLLDKTDNRSVLVSKAEMYGDGTTVEIVGGTGGATSYGMNVAAREPSANDGERILVLDYPWLNARTSHDWAGDKLKSDVPGIPVFARHNGMINTLYTGGSVQLKRPSEINPAYPAVRQDLWGE
ncbi:MAG: hypothetical protein HN350_18630 [Phycisphaerales bacterium]|nr:hypothetical protein [Phycisphaerales bacterium]